MKQQDRPPRPADLAISGNRMITVLLEKIWGMNYRQINPQSMASTLPLMMTAFYASIATRDGEPLTRTELAKKMGMPRTTIVNYIETLVEHKRVKLVSGRKRGRGQEKVIVTDLELIDRLMTLEHFQYCAALIQDCLDELNRLLPLVTIS